MKIVMIAENDPAGVAINFTKAINEHTQHSCRLITTRTVYNFNFEKDLHIPDLRDDGFELISELLKSADIIHFHILADENIKLGPLCVKDFVKGKAIVHHHHGHPDFRSSPGKYHSKYKSLGRQKLLVSTPDLLHLLPGAKWQPNLVPVNNPLYMPLKGKSNGSVRIAHSPTRKDLKNTADLINSVNRSKDSGLPVELELIENTEHKECLRRKRNCHLLFDHLQGYFGVSSLEGLSQGLCVIAGLDEWNQRNIAEFCRCKNLPWVITNREDLIATIVELVENRDLRIEKSSKARCFMETCWNEEAVVMQLINFYQK